jgi:hypothetical protein
MDPNATLAEILKITRRIDVFQEGDAERLAELIISLDGWLSAGGFKPDAWK